MQCPFCVIRKWKKCFGKTTITDFVRDCSIIHFRVDSRRAVTQPTDHHRYCFDSSCYNNFDGMTFNSDESDWNMEPILLIYRGYKLQHSSIILWLNCVIETSNQDCSFYIKTKLPKILLHICRKESPQFYRQSLTKWRFWQSIQSNPNDFCC
jgi:hypothetical protein